MLNKSFIYNLFIIPLLILVQVFVFNNMYFTISNHKYIPIIYIIWIIFFPYGKSDKFFFLIFCFLLGFGIDCFLDTGGVNAFASVLIGYLRTPIILYISDLNKELKLLRFSDLNIIQLLLYILILIFIHHFSLFLLEVFKLSQIIYVLKETAITTVYSFIYIIIFYIFFKNNFEK